MAKMITKEMLESYKSNFVGSESKMLAMNAAAVNGLVKSATSNEALRQNRHSYSLELNQGKITNQKQSGRCWMFAAMNVMRFDIIKKLNLEDIELSQNYILFYDKLEKSNYFLENILDTLDEPTNSRLINFLLMAPVGDGGQWDMLCGLVEKYGIVPKDAMPETEASSATRDLCKYITVKLREYACILRREYKQGAAREQLEAKKEGMLKTIYDMLCIALGTPPESFTFEMRNKDKDFIRDTDITPREFYQKYVGWNLIDYVSLINAPTDDKPYGKTYTVKMLGSVKEGRPVKYLNLPIDELKKAAIAQMQDGLPVWFGCDVGQCSTRDTGIMDTEALKLDELFGTSFSMTKAERLDYGESLMTHAMVFQGVNLDDTGNPTRWRVENSWGKEPGKDGYYVMSDSWFDEYMYQVVVHKKYLTAEQRAQFEQAPIVLEPWDPMGSLA